MYHHYFKIPSSKSIGKHIILLLLYFTVNSDTACDYVSSVYRL
jgi:hypothetical protein